MYFTIISGAAACESRIVTKTISNLHLLLIFLLCESVFAPLELLIHLFSSFFYFAHTNSNCIEMLCAVCSYDTLGYLKCRNEHVLCKDCTSLLLEPAQCPICSVSIDHLPKRVFNQKYIEISCSEYDFFPHASLR